MIVGAGQAGARTAEALRANGFDGAITLIGEEAERPYERPPLSKSVLMGEEPFTRAYLHPEDYYSANGIELVLATRVESIEPSRKELTLAGGRSIAYTKLAVCTGSRPRRLGPADPGLAAVHYLRTLRDCGALAKELVPGRRLVAVGGGFIGLELASSALKLGLHVTVVEQKPSLLDRAVPAQIGAYVQSLHAARGIDVRLNSRVAAVRGTARVESVELADGCTLPADVVAVGIGVIPNSELAEAAGATSKDGLLVDEYGQTSVLDVYAAGDVTNHPNPILGRRVRLESWQNAQNQAIAVAKNMLGIRTPYSEVPWFWSDQLGHNIQLLGFAQSQDEVVWRGDRDAGRSIAFTLADGRVTSLIAFNAGAELRFGRRLIESRVQIAAEVLRDISRPLKDIVSGIPRPRAQNPQLPEGEHHERRPVAN